MKKENNISVYIKFNNDINIKQLESFINDNFKDIIIGDIILFPNYNNILGFKVKEEYNIIYVSFKLKEIYKTNNFDISFGNKFKGYYNIHVYRENDNIKINGLNYEILDKYNKMISLPNLNSEYVKKEKIGKGIYEVTFKDGTKDIINTNVLILIH